GLPSGATCEIDTCLPAYGRDRTMVTVPNDMEVVLRHGLILEGRVTRADAKEIASGVRVAAQGGDQSGGGEATPVGEGRVRSESLPADDVYNVWADDEGWTVIAHAAVGGKGGDTVRLPDLQLIKGGFIEGVVIDVATREGVEPGITGDVGLYGPARPRS